MSEGEPCDRRPSPGYGETYSRSDALIVTPVGFSIVFFAYAVPNVEATLFLILIDDQVDAEDHRREASSTLMVAQVRPGLRAEPASDSVLISQGCSKRRRIVERPSDDLDSGRNSRLGPVPRAAT